MRSGQTTHRSFIRPCWYSSPMEGKRPELDCAGAFLLVRCVRAKSTSWSQISPSKLHATSLLCMLSLLSRWRSNGADQLTSSPLTVFAKAKKKEKKRKSIAGAIRLQLWERLTYCFNSRHRWCFWVLCKGIFTASVVCWHNCWAYNAWLYCR